MQLVKLKKARDTSASRGLGELVVELLGVVVLVRYLIKIPVSII